MAKGSQFERDVCKRLSEWWAGKDADIFWRTAMSGGRATVRVRKGHATAHAGDICAVDNRGRGFTKKITVELKRGYNKATVADLIDKPPTARPQVLEQWIDQAATAARGRTPYWIIIHKRDRREAVVYFPHLLWLKMFGEAYTPSPFVTVKIKTKRVLLKVSGTTLSNWFWLVLPTRIKELQ